MTLKLGSWRNRSYPIRIRVDGHVVYQGATPRSLEQCAGAQRSSVAVVVERDAYDPIPMSDRIVLVASGLAGLALAVMALMGWVQ